MVKIYLVSDDGGTPIYVTTNKDRFLGFAQRTVELGLEDIHLQVWEDETMVFENWITQAVLDKFDR